MKLFVNGCSHTEGTELSLDGDLTQAWPHKLAPMLNAELVNKSCAGSSNDRIVRTTIEEISTDPIPPDLAIVQFTGADRFEGIREDCTGYEQFIPNPYLDRKVWDVIGHKLSKVNAAFFHKHFNWRTEGSNDLLNLKMVTQILALQNLFENHDIPYIFIIWYDIPFNVRQSDLYRTLSFNNILNDHYGAGHIIHSHGFKLSNVQRKDGTTDKHFQADAHTFMANAIYDFYLNKTHLTLNGKYRDRDHKEVVHIYD